MSYNLCAATGFFMVHTIEHLRPRQVERVAFYTPPPGRQALACARTIAGWLEDNQGLTKPRTREEVLSGIIDGSSILAWHTADPTKKRPIYELAGHIGIPRLRKVPSGSPRGFDYATEVGSLVVAPVFRGQAIAVGLIKRVTPRAATITYAGKTLLVCAVTTSDASTQAFARCDYVPAQQLWPLLPNERLQSFVESGKQLMIHSPNTFDGQ